MELTPVKRNNLKDGLITRSAVSDSTYPMSACLESLNLHYDTIGQVTLRKGSTQLGNTLASSDILGLYNFIDSGSGTNNQIIAVNGTVLYYLSSNTWTSKRTGLTSGSRANFTTFLDYVFMVNGTEATAIWDGNPSNSFVTTGNAASAPTGKYIENYRSRVWIAGNSTYPDRLYYSSIPSSVTTPIITWNTSVTTGDWIDISPSDGENITALHRTKVALLAFKKNHIYQVYSVDQVDPDPKINVGTWSQESIIEAKNGVYFHHPTGIYRYANGGVQEISQPVIDIIQNISLANYSKITGWIEPDGNHLCWSVGNVTYKGVTYSNVVIRYTISTGVWTHYSYPYQFISSSPYNDGTELFVLGGDTSGKIYKIDVGLTDNGDSLFYSLVHGVDSVDDSDSTIKKIKKMYFVHSGGTGSNADYQRTTDHPNDWSKRVLQFKMNDTGINGANIEGRKLRFRVSGNSKGEPFEYEGYSIIEGTTEEVTFT